MGGVPTHFISALLAARILPGISYLLLQKHTMFLPSCRLKATTNTCHTFCWHYPNFPLGAAQSQHKPVFLCLLYPLPLGKAQPFLCPGVCVLGLTIYWQVPKHGLETKFRAGSSPLGRLMMHFWHISVQKTIYFENHLVGELPKEELCYSLCFQNNQQIRSAGDTQTKDNNSRQHSIQTV